MMLFINTIFFFLKIKFNMKNVHFQQFFVVVKMTERWKNQSEVCNYFTQLFIYFITIG